MAVRSWATRRGRVSSNGIMPLSVCGRINLIDARYEYRLRRDHAYYEYFDISEMKSFDQSETTFDWYPLPNVSFLLYS